MIKALVIIFCTVQMLDLATYALAPQYEANPAMAALPPYLVAIAKTAGICLALFIVSRIATPSLQALALGVGIAIGAFCVGANVATLSMVL